MDVQTVIDRLGQLVQGWLEQLSSPSFYAQAGIIVLTIVLALTLAIVLRKRSPLLRQPPQHGPLYPLRKILYKHNDLLFPLINVLLLSISVELSTLLIQQR